MAFGKRLASREPTSGSRCRQTRVVRKASARCRVGQSRRHRHGAHPGETRGVARQAAPELTIDAGSGAGTVACACARAPSARPRSSESARRHPAWPPCVSVKPECLRSRAVHARPVPHRVADARAPGRDSPGSRAGPGSSVCGRPSTHRLWTAGLCHCAPSLKLNSYQFDSLAAPVVPLTVKTTSSGPNPPPRRPR